MSSLIPAEKWGNVFFVPSWTEVERLLVTPQVYVQYNTKIHVSCRSSNLICVMSCSVCGLQYVGQTKRTIAKRFTEHFRSINKDNSTDLKHVHFNSAGHHGTKDIRIFIISLIKEHPDGLQSQRARDKMERFWYHQLGTLVPRGLNVEKTPKSSYH